MTESFGDSYPRVYRPSKANTILSYFFAAVFIGLGAFAISTANTLTNVRGDTAGQGSIFLIIFLIPLAIGMLMFLGGLKSKVLLYQDAIETSGLWSTKRLMRYEIAGRRLIQTRNSSITKLIPLDSTRPTLSLSGIQTDAILDAWINALPDLDAKDLQQSRQEIEQDLGLGSTKEERLASLGKAKSIANVLNFGGFFIAMLGAIASFAPAAIFTILAVLPLVAIVLRVCYPNLYKLNSNARLDVHPNLGLAIISPGFGLLMSACRYFPILEWQAPAVLALAIACILSAVLFMAEESKEARVWLKALFILVLLVPYGYGGVMGGNAIFDNHQEHTIYKVLVLGKHISRGRKGGTNYYVNLQPWADGQGTTNISVDSSFYDQVHTGSYLCMNVRPGALNMRWYQMMFCDGGPSSRGW